MELWGLPLIEWFGYAASVVVAVSLTMNSLLRLRWYNLAGAAMFSTYGFVIGALPVGFLNLFIVFADIYYLVLMYRTKDEFRMMNLGGDDEFLAYYLAEHRDDMARIFPAFFPWWDGRTDQGSGEAAMATPPQTFYLVKNGIPIGILVGHETGPRTFRILLDYVSPAYRDFRMGRHLYGPGGFFLQRGYDHLEARASTPLHRNYLERMGFAHLRDDILTKALT
jgi:hypothetical protein